MTLTTLTAGRVQPRAVPAARPRRFVRFDPLNHRSDHAGYRNPAFCEEFARWAAQHIRHRANGRKVVIVTCDRSSRAVAAPLLRRLAHATERFVSKYTEAEVEARSLSIYFDPARAIMPPGGVRRDKFTDPNDPTEFVVFVDDYFASCRALNAMANAMRLDLYLVARSGESFRWIESDHGWKMPRLTLKEERC